MPDFSPDTILVKRTTVAGRVPLLSSLSLGEFAVNTTDGLIFLKQQVNNQDVLINFPHSKIIPYTLDLGLSSVNFQYGNNNISQIFASVLGGVDNNVSGAGSTIVNGESNLISADFATILNGYNNRIIPTGNYSSILGGQNNLISHQNSFTLGTNLSSHAENFTYVNNISGKFWGDGSELRDTRDTTKLPLAGGTLTGALFGNDANFSNSVYSTTISAVDFIGNGTLLTGIAKLDSPAFVGTPSAPTAPANTSSTQLATTQFVMQNRGDRYLTSSSTSLALLNNQTYSLTAGTGLSYTSPQQITLAYNSTNYMDANVVSYNIDTGAMVINNTNRTGTGTYSTWTVNVKSTPVAGGLLAANNLSDVASASVSLTNLGGFPSTGGTLAGGLTGTLAQFNSVTYTPNAVDLPYELGKVWYDTNRDALCYYNSVSSNKLHIGQEIQQYVRNATADTIKKGDVVTIRGFTSQSPDVVLAIATSLSGSIITGVANQDIPPNSNGYIVTIGEVANFDTSRFSAGEDLFLSPLSAGKITNVLPTNPYFAVQVGVCMYSHATNGKLLVYTQYLGTAANTVVGIMGIEQLPPSLSSTVSTVDGLSANWSSVYSTVQSNSAVNWNYQGTDLKALSGNWQNTYTTVQNTSANWSSVYSTVQSNSASYVTLSATQTLTNKTVVDWMTLVRGYKTTPTLNTTIATGEVWNYVYTSSPSDKTYYRFIATDGSEDSFYSAFNGTSVSGLIAGKAITI